MDIATGIGDSEMRTNAQANVLLRWFERDRAAAMQCMQSLPLGPTRDLAAMYISRDLSMRKIEDRQAAVNMASGIGDSKMRTDALKIAVEEWSQRDRAAATQWINSSSLPQEVKTQLLAKAQLLPENPLPLPIIVPPSLK